MVTDLEFWDGLDDDEAEINTAGVPPYDVDLTVQRLNWMMRPIETVELFTNLILDLGCGTGRLTHAMAMAHPDKHFLGIDISPNMIERALARGNAVGNLGYSVLTNDFRNLSGAYSIRVFQHIDQKTCDSYLQLIHATLQASCCFVFDYVVGTDHEPRNYQRPELWGYQQGYKAGFSHVEEFHEDIYERRYVRCVK